MMTEAAFLIAMMLGRQPGLVETIYDMAGLEGVIVCEYESQFNARAFRREACEGTSWGLWQLYDKCHKQYRDDLLLHCVYGAAFWRECMDKGKTISRAYSIYNSGSPKASIIKGREVEAKYNSLAMYLYRRMR